MKKTLIILSIFSVYFLFSCQQNDDLNIKNPLIGTWYLDEQVQVNNETIKTYVRVTDNADLKANLSFEESNNYYQSTPMISFCMTPPLSFITIEGQWRRSDDMIILKNKSDFINYQIIFIDSNSLKIKMIQ
jgi:hypothetical protein